MAHAFQRSSQLDLPSQSTAGIKTGEAAEGPDREDISIGGVAYSAALVEHTSNVLLERRKLVALICDITCCLDRTASRERGMKITKYDAKESHLWPVSIGQLLVNQQLYSSLNGLSVRMPGHAHKNSND